MYGYSTTLLDWLDDLSINRKVWGISSRRLQVTLLITGEDASTLLLGRIKDGIAGLKNQTATAEKYSDLEKGPATFGVAKRLRDNDVELHSDNQVSF